MPRPDKHLFPLPEFRLKFAEVGEDAGMARTLQAAALPRIEARQVPATATLAALGIVYGDIGTSPLYGFKQAADAAGAISPETIIGIVSVILWSLMESTSATPPMSAEPTSRSGVRRARKRVILQYPE
jgi:K+ potassium transporter